MRLLFDGRVIQDHFPGIGRYAYNLVAAMPPLLRDDDSVTILIDPRGPNTRYDLASLAGDRVALEPSSAPIFSLGTALGRHTANARARFDVAHFPYYVRPYVGGPPSVTTIHDLIPLLFPRLSPNARTRLLTRWLNALAARASTHIIAVSCSSADDIARLFPFAQRKISVVPEAADAGFAPKPPDAIAGVRAKLHLPDRFTLYLASNKPHKNLVALVEAWQLLLAQFPAASSFERPTLVIAGHQDPRFPEAPARARELGLGDSVRFIGDVPNADLPALYSACELFVFPSLYEGFGLTPLEAMACGAPVVCSNASSFPEVMGDAGLLVDPRSPRDIAEACARALRDDVLRADLARRSLAQAAKFSWASAAEQTLSVYRDVAASK